MKTLNYLPVGYEKLRTEKPYVNLSKLPEGEYKFRIVQQPIGGWIDWKDKKPMRFRPDDQPRTSVDPSRPVRPFWAMYVWDYAQEGLYVMEVTQNGIRKDLENLGMNEDWGDLTSFDFKIKKEGTGIDTSYSVIPIPPKPISKTIKEALESCPVRLEALYEGKDPWKDLEGDVNEMTGEIAWPKISESQSAQLDQLLLKLNDEGMKEFICKRASVTSIYDLPLEKFSGVIGYLEEQIKLRGERK